MDKLKVYFRKMKKHHFWVLTGLVLLLALSTWYLATGKLQAETAANITTIEGKFNALRGITAKTQHPNPSFKSGMQELESILHKDVKEAWTAVYDDQKKQVLKWPQELGKRFLDWINDPKHFEAEIPQPYRELYWNYVKEEFEHTLLKIVEARPYWETGEDEPGTGMNITARRRMESGPGGRAKSKQPKKDYKVIWNVKNQQLIDEQLEFPDGRPNSRGIL